MANGTVLPFLCLILVCTLHLSNGQCGVNEELSECTNDCNTCEQQGFCPDCSGIGCDCLPGFSRDFNGVCIPTNQCQSMEETMPWEMVQDASPRRCRNKRCNNTCKRSGFGGGRCVRRRCKCSKD